MDSTENEIHYAVLSSGLRTVMHYRPGSAVEHCGVAVRAGSRDEAPDHYGLAHFVEHIQGHTASTGMAHSQPHGADRG